MATHTLNRVPYALQKPAVKVTSLQVTLNCRLFTEALELIESTPKIILFDMKKGRDNSCLTQFFLFDITVLRFV